MARDRHGIVSRNLGNTALLFLSDRHCLWLPALLDIVQIVVPMGYSGISNLWQIVVRIEQGGAEGMGLISIAAVCVTTGATPAKSHPGSWVGCVYKHGVGNYIGVAGKNHLFAAKVSAFIIKMKVILAPLISVLDEK